jgi:hypothetical protein
MNLKSGIKNWLMVGTMAVLFIVVMKVVFNKYPVAGVTDVVNAV